MSFALQVSRRAAVTAVAVITTPSAPDASACNNSTVQCCVERLVRTGVAVMLNGPSAMALA